MQDITDRLAAALREAIRFLPALHASNTDEAYANACKALTEYDTAGTHYRRPVPPCGHGLFEACPECFVDDEDA